MKLYTYFRSTSAYRVRITLEYKNIPYDLVPVNIKEGEHQQTPYRQRNVQARIPTLEDQGFQLGQSLAIIDYLEEKHQTPSIYPEDMNQRAWVRYFSQIICCDCHPLNNFGVLQYLKNELHHSQEDVMKWYYHWLKVTFDTLESLCMNNPTHGHFCLGDRLTLADICLIPQIYNAFRFEFPMDAYPRLLSINEHCLQLPYFDKARPERQPDALT